MDLQRAWKPTSSLMTGRPVTEGGLTKAALVEAVAHVADLTKKDAETIVDTTFGSIVEALRPGGMSNSAASAAFVSGPRAAQGT